MTQWSPIRDHFVYAPANERWRYIVTSSLIGWAHTQSDPCRSNHLDLQQSILSNFWQPFKLHVTIWPHFGDLSPGSLGRYFEPHIWFICQAISDYFQIFYFHYEHTMNSEIWEKKIDCIIYNQTSQNGLRYNFVNRYIAVIYMYSSLCRCTIDKVSWQYGLLVFGFMALNSDIAKIFCQNDNKNWTQSTYNQDTTEGNSTSRNYLWLQLILTLAWAALMVVAGIGRHVLWSTRVYVFDLAWSVWFMIIMNFQPGSIMFTAWKISHNSQLSLH